MKKERNRKRGKKKKRKRKGKDTGHGCAISFDGSRLAMEIAMMK